MIEVLIHLNSQKKNGTVCALNSHKLHLILTFKGKKKTNLVGVNKNFHCLAQMEYNIQQNRPSNTKEQQEQTLLNQRNYPTPGCYAIWFFSLLLSRHTSATPMAVLSLALTHTEYGLYWLWLFSSFSSSLLHSLWPSRGNLSILVLNFEP